MSKTISLDYDIAQQVGLTAALVFNELNFWSTKGRREDGWIYKSYEDLTERLPLSERTIRRAYTKLRAAGMIKTKVMKVNGDPTLHYTVCKQFPFGNNCRKETANMSETIETANLAETSIYTVSNHKDGKTQQQKERDLLLLVNKTTGRLFRTLPSKGVKKLLVGFTMVEIEAALTALAADPWHIDMMKGLGIDYFIRPTTIDKFLQIANASNYRDPRVFGDAA